MKKKKIKKCIQYFETMKNEILKIESDKVNKQVVQSETMPTHITGDFKILSTEETEYIDYAIKLLNKKLIKKQNIKSC